MSGYSQAAPGDLVWSPADGDSVRVLEVLDRMYLVRDRNGNQAFLLFTDAEAL